MRCATFQEFEESAETGVDLGAGHQMVEVPAPDRRLPMPGIKEAGDDRSLEI